MEAGCGQLWLASTEAGCRQLWKAAVSFEGSWAWPAGVAGRGLLEGEGLLVSCLGLPYFYPMIAKGMLTKALAVQRLALVLTCFYA